MAIRPESRAKFERQGRELTAYHLQIDNMHSEDKNEIIEWLGETSHQQIGKESRRFWATIIVAIVAAIGAWISAWPIIEQWVCKR